MPHHGDFDVQIEIDGVPAQEYNVTSAVRPGGATETRATICSVSGARFGANMRYTTNNIGEDYLGNVYVDGKFVVKTAERLDNRDYRLTYAIDGSLKRPLEFAPTRVVADAGELADRQDVALAEDRVAGEVGTIKVEIWAARFGQNNQTNANEGSNWKQSVLSEQQKKAVFVTHSTRIGDPIGDYVRPSTRGYPSNLVAVFVFEYASREMLEVSGRIPRPVQLEASPAGPTAHAPSTPSPTNTRKRHLDTSDNDDDQSELAKVKDENTRRVSAQSHTDTKRRRTVSPSRRAPSVVKEEKVVITLDSDDDSAPPTRRRSAPTRPNEKAEKIVVDLMDDDEE